MQKTSADLSSQQIDGGFRGTVNEARFSRGFRVSLGYLGKAAYRLEAEHCACLQHQTLPWRGQMLHQTTS